MQAKADTKNPRKRYRLRGLLSAVSLALCAIFFGTLCHSLWHFTPRAGLEPATTRLTAECSTIELSRNNLIQPSSSIVPYFPAVKYFGKVGVKNLGVKMIFTAAVLPICFYFMREAEIKFPFCPFFVCFFVSGVIRS